MEQKIEAALRGALERFSTRLTELEQQIAGGRARHAAAAPANELAHLLTQSEGMRALLKGASPSAAVEVPTHLIVKAAITHQAPGVADPLDQPARGSIVAAPEQRLTIRGLFSVLPTSSGAVEVVRENTFTNGAAIQGNDASPTGSGEGSLKAESHLTFTLEQMSVPTIAHFTVASRQILADAPRLQAHVNSRLLYGLALKEETEFLTGSGTGLSMSGLNTEASAYAYGVTNDTALDTLEKAINQLQIANYEPSGIILHPTDWSAIKRLKDSQGRYLLGDPAAMTLPSIWGLPVVPTPSQTAGKFTVLDARQVGYIADRETATVRISENVNDQFVRNLVTILAEERTLLVIERPTAIVYGNVSHAG